MQFNFSINIEKRHLVFLFMGFLMLGMGVVFANDGDLGLFSHGSDDVVVKNSDGNEVSLQEFIDGLDLGDSEVMVKNSKGEDVSLQSLIDSGELGGGGLKFTGQVHSGACQAPRGRRRNCVLAGLDYHFCALRGAAGIGSGEFGYIYKDSRYWRLYTGKGGWPGVYYWSCIK